MDEALELLESSANMMRGMTLDPSIPAHAKAALWSRIKDIESFVEKSLNILDSVEGKK